MSEHDDALQARAAYDAAIAYARDRRAEYVEALRVLHARGWSLADIARELGISRSRVHRIIAPDEKM